MPSPWEGHAGPGWYGPPIPPRPDVRPYPPQDEPVVRPRRSPLTVALATLVAVTVLIGSGIGIGTLLTRHGGSASSTSASASFADRSGVVDIDTFTTRTGMHQGPDFPLGAGTGMIITKAGQVLTNNHVIEGATRIQVTIPGGGQFVARVLGADPTDDVALLQIEGGGSDFSTVTVADSGAVRVADRVVAVGNALGRGGEPAVAAGSVWGLDQSIQVRDAHGQLDSLDGVIQVQAAVRPGDSGGPLENENGDVVGMVTAADAHKNGAASEVAFAIPVNTALGIVQRIRLGDAGDPIVIGDAGYLGVRVEDLTTQSGSSLGLGPNQGAYIAGVMPGSPAANIGMPASSVITAVDGHPVTSADSLGPLIHFHSPGESISVTWVDSSGTHTASAALVAGPAV
jgi:S1-C subfamily serine protease